ncbi:hypothetical protein BKA67DRAFT_529399 [Truncatella angustata]|uniref:Uncharacterized protein n=1 Tax=Truncatella angustata TaxID=152316 RepID=A0A9P8UU85_9PEZI|nr:uncharacterized protein BKA67DRAFT_529399 [Truncatella angustata]KAH6659229.1 hypothetical protein BKA67DRAFT_529399 [Truncatella angustata]
MEASPLIRAHDHARAASEATHASNSTVAVNEHTRAAGEFANAAKTTTSVEALRTLKLLEQHHQRLSELLRAPLEQNKSQQATENASRAAGEKGDAIPATAALEPSDGGSKDEQNTATSAEKATQPLPSLPKQQRYPTRDLGASIASNLASARGIPRSKYRSQPLNPSVSNTEVPGNLALTPERSSSGSKSKMQSMIDGPDRPSPSSPGKISRQGSLEQRASEIDKAISKSPESNATSNDSGFSNFYSAFGSIINRISAPLAFAGLPLINEDLTEEPASEPTPAPEPQVQRRLRHKASATVSVEPNLNKIISKAAMNALNRDGRFATDSFYVVPTSGHTASYASILTYADKEKRRLEASVHSELSNVAEEDEDDFVDARESQAPSSPGMRRKTGKTRSDRELNNVVEELYLENKSLKDALDKLSKRLHAFESMSQNSGMRLAESMRLMRPTSPIASGVTAGAGGDDQLRRRNTELEVQVGLVTKQMEDMQKENAKLRAYLDRYREKWDQLRAGAKARRAAAHGSSEATETAPQSPSLT